MKFTFVLQVKNAGAYWGGYAFDEIKNLTKGSISYLYYHYNFKSPLHEQTLKYLLPIWLDDGGVTLPIKDWQLTL